MSLITDLTPPSNSTKDLAEITKNKFGITFHKNMSIGDMAKKWVKEASTEIKEKYPEINMLLNSANIAVNAKIELRKAQVIADNTYKTVKGAIEDASAILTGQTQQIAAKATSISTKVATEAEVIVLNTLENKAINLLTTLI